MIPTNPWDLLHIRLIPKNETLHYYDSKIHIIYVLVGEAEIKDDTRFVSLKKDDFIVLSRSIPHELSIHSSSRVFELSFNYSLVDELEDNQYDLIFFGNSVTEGSGVDEEIKVEINSLIEQYIFREKGKTSTLLKRYFSLLELLEDNYIHRNKLSTVKTMAKKVIELKNFIDNHFDQEIRIAEIADKMYVSQHYLSRSFTKQFEKSITEYLVEKRLEKVRRDLLETEKSVTDIAFSAGFNNINSFNRLFKKYQGLTPSDYRKEVKSHVKVTTSQGIPKEDLAYLKVYFGQKTKTTTEETLVVKNEMLEKNRLRGTLINLGYAEDILMSGYYQQLKLIANRGFFQYGRLWGLLSDSVLPKIEGQYDFTKVDMILSSIIDAGLIPFIDLGFKGKTVYKTHGKPIIHTHYTRDSNMIQDILERYCVFFEYCKKKFGESALDKWVVEVWKPSELVVKTNDLADLMRIKDGNKIMNISDTAGYLWFFDKVYTTIKEINTNIRIGGCGLGLDVEKEDLEAFLANWQAMGTLPDYFSISLFHMDEITQSLYSGKRANPISPDTDYMINSVKEFKKLLSKFTRNLPLLVTEFNVTILNRHIINDTAFKATYIIKNILDVENEVDLMGYWLLSDISVTSYDTNQQEIFGGAGLLTKTGIPKAAYYAFDFLNRLFPDVIYKDKEVYLSKKNDHHFSGLFYFYNHLNTTYYYNSEGDFHEKNAYSIFKNKKRRKWHLRIEDVDPGFYTVLSFKMGRDHGSLLERIIELGENKELSREEIDFLKHRSRPDLTKNIVETHNRQLNFSIELESHEALFIDFRRNQT